MQADDDVLHRLQVLGPQDDARHGQRVNLVACRERKGVAVQLVALVVVFDSVREVDDVGGVFFQGVTELHRHLLAHGADEWHRAWGRGDDDLLLLVLQVDDFVKGDFHLVALEVKRPGRWRRLDDLRRRIVTRSALRRPDTGTGHEQQPHDHSHQPICPPFSHNPTDLQR